MKRKTTEVKQDISQNERNKNLSELMVLLTVI